MTVCVFLHKDDPAEHSGILSAERPDVRKTRLPQVLRQKQKSSKTQRQKAAVARAAHLQKPAGYRRFTPQSELPAERFDEQGNRVCRLCAGVLTGRRRSWCSQACQDHWLIRSIPSFARKKVFERDRGVCRSCGVDAHTRDTLIARKVRAEEKRVKGLLTASQLRQHLENHLLQVVTESGLETPKMMGWQMDHIVAVEDGGGECGLENLQTLCTVCHKQKSRAQTALRARKRKTSAAPVV